MPLCSATREHSAISALTRPSSSIGSQLPRDAADILEAVLNELGQLGELWRLLAGPPGGVLGSQDDRGQRLADLIIVQLPRNPETLLLLRSQHAPGAFAPLVLESLEHLVERLSERQHLAARTLEPHCPLARTQKIDPQPSPGRIAAAAPRPGAPTAGRRPAV